MGASNDNALAGATISVTAGAGLQVQNVSNPTALVLSSPDLSQSSDPFAVDLNWTANFKSLFFTYAPNSAVSLVATSGDISIAGFAPTPPAVGVVPISNNLSNVLPPNVTIAALQGSISGVGNPRSLPRLVVFPGSQDSLQMLANGDIGDVYVRVSDASVAALPSPASSAETFALKAPDDNQLLGGFSTVGPVAQGAAAPDFLVSANGSIFDSRFEFPRASVIRAGLDIDNPRLLLQNLGPNDVTEVIAGRDILSLASYRNNVPLEQPGYITISGPGQLVVEAGRNIDLGTSTGIIASGNTENLILQNSTSAQLTIMAGVTSLVSEAALDQMFSGLLAAGTAINAQAGEAAIAAAFPPGSTGPGSLSMYFSSIRTVSGSGIDLVVPQGDINVGLPTPVRSDLGIFTEEGGSIRVLVGGDFNVNQSKVVTLFGGDILVYSRFGDIDAGRGARNSQLNAPPQRVPVLDANGNETGLFFFLPSLTAEGSGIRTLTSNLGGAGGPITPPPPGAIYLFALKGKVDAGEAGVAAAGNLVVAAQQVVNASNFSAGGTTTGVPLSASASLAGVLSTANSAVAGTTKAVENLAQSAADNAKPTTTAQYIPSFITVEVTGFGEDQQSK